MSKKHLLRFLLIVGILFMSMLLWKRQQSTEAPQELPEVVPSKPMPRKPPVVEAPAPTIGDETLSPAPLKKGERSFYGRLPPGVKDIRQLPMANRPSPEWRKKLETHIKRIGGPNLKSYEMTAEESYVIPDGTEGRYVERVAVKITGKKGEYTSFFAEVDSQTGYVIKTWGAAIPEKAPHQH